MTYWETIHTTEKEGFNLELSITHEELHPRDCFDDSIEDISEICRKIDSGALYWFTARMRAFKHDIELGSDYLGACLYDNLREFIDDAYCEDLADNALKEARKNLKILRGE